MKKIRRQFAVYFISLISVCIGFWLYKFGWNAILLIFMPLAMWLVMDWDAKVNHDDEVTE